MSRRGRAARRQRLIESGQWEPSAILVTTAAKTQEARGRAMHAERSEWISAVGALGWQKELNRRRAARIARHRERRSA